MTDANKVSYSDQADTAKYKTSANPGNIGVRANSEIYEAPLVAIGTVMRAGGGTYDVEVAILKMPWPVTCTVAQSTAASFLGTSECSLPPAGTKVIVLLPNHNSKVGIIIGAYPAANRGPSGSPRPTNNNLIDLEGSASVATEAAYQTPAQDPQYTTRVDAAAQRYLDSFPGNKCWFNDQGVALSLLNLMLILKATDRAQLQFGVLDDLVRLISNHWQHFSAQGTEQIFNDGGYLTHETGVSMYQWEHSGFLELGTKAFAAGDGKVLKDSLATRYDHTTGVPSARKRLQTFSGYLGDILNMFVANPDPNIKTDTVDQEAVDQGLLHTHIDTSGRLTIKSATGISFQRADRIPVPKRMREPWDPEGDKVENEQGKSTDKKEPYKFEDQGTRSMLMRDANAYRDAQAYAKLAKRTKDFYVPEEADMQQPKDEYDTNSKGREEFEKNKDRRAYFNLEDDGSIVFRDAWGSELIMRGGNIIVTCAGQMELRTGKSIVQLAGDDVVIKAKNSIDVTATDKDVRIKADRNLHVLAEGLNGGGGILLESKSTGPGASYEGKGEAVSSTGITLKAQDSTVLVTAPTVHLAPENNFILDGMDSDGNPHAVVSIGGIRQFVCTAEEYAALTVADTAGVLVTPGFAVVAGGTAVLAGGTSTGVLEGAKAWQPMAKVYLEDGSYYDRLQRETLTDLKETFLDGVEWLGAYPPEQRLTIMFTYRSSQECGTLEATEVEGGSGFAVYQPGWAHMANSGSPFVPVTLTTWEESPIEETYAWPGQAAYEAESYVKVEEEAYISDPATGVAVNRAEAIGANGVPGATTKVAFSEYEIVQVT